MNEFTGLEIVVMKGLSTERKKEKEEEIGGGEVDEIVFNVFLYFQLTLSMVAECRRGDSLFLNFGEGRTRLGVCLKH